MTITTQLKAARANVAKFSFGTDEWEAAMQKVRELVDAVNEVAPKFAYTSIDGDVFSV